MPPAWPATVATRARPLRKLSALGQDSPPRRRIPTRRPVGGRPAGQESSGPYGLPRKAFRNNHLQCRIPFPFDPESSSLCLRRAWALRIGREGLMTVNEMIERLQEVAEDGFGECELRLAFQPRWAFAAAR